MPTRARNTVLQALTNWCDAHLEDLGLYVGIYSIHWKNAYRFQTIGWRLGTLQCSLVRARASIQHILEYQERVFKWRLCMGLDRIRGRINQFFDSLDDFIQSPKLGHVVKGPHQVLGHDQNILFIQHKEPVWGLQLEGLRLPLIQLVCYRYYQLQFYLWLSRKIIWKELFGFCIESWIISSNMMINLNFCWAGS